MNFSLRLFVPTLLSLTLVSGLALADTNPCGNIELKAISSCEFRTSGGCEAECTPLKLVYSCDGQCNSEVTVTCTGSCQTDCEAECKVDPPKFDCKGSCTADCEANIQARCQGEDDQAGCVSYCQGMCNTDCSTQCSGVAPSADCKTKCEGSCRGTCETDSNFDCSLKCSGELDGGCKAQCQRPEGALFCDGQFINVTDIPACINYLASNLNVKVEAKAEASGSASLTADGISSSNCSVTEGPASSLGWLGAAFGVMALGLRGRRRR